MEPFEGLDFYDIESLLTEEEIMIRDMVRDWVDEEVLPKIDLFESVILSIDIMTSIYISSLSMG